MVIKECQPTVAVWNSATSWFNQLPLEIWIHQLLERHRDNGHRSIVRLRAHRLMMAQRRYRLYLDYYPGGDLHDLTRHIFLAPNQATKQQNWLPEAFMWYIFKCLVDGLQVLNQGNLNFPTAGWRPIHHMDIRPSNIFIDIDPDRKVNRQKVSLFADHTPWHVY